MFSKPKGTRDYFLKQQEEFNFVKSKLINISNTFNYSEITFPTFEYEELFIKGIGNDNDVVNNEMYTFKDKSERNLTLRPEGTASTVRLCLENKLIFQNQKQKLFYIANMFRYERPQKGRQREFFQFGVENFNNPSIGSDIEIILLAKKILQELNITKYILKINSIGSLKSREKYTAKLKEYYLQNIEKLSEQSQAKVNLNPLRILDSSIEQDIEVNKNSPLIREFLTNDEKESIDKIKSILDELKIKYIYDQTLVRGLEYYNDLVFEFVSIDIENLGAKATIIGGGRYNKLVSQISQQQLDVPAIGFALGIERLMLACSETLNKINQKQIDHFILTTSESDLPFAFNYQKELLQRNIDSKIECNFDDIKIKDKIEKALKQKPKNIYIISNAKLEKIIKS